MHRRISLRWWVCVLLGLLMAACGGGQAAGDDRGWEAEGELPSAVGVFADETVREAFRMAPDAAEGVKVLRLPAALESYLERIDFSAGVYGAPLFRWLLTGLPFSSEADAATFAVAWVRQPYAGLVVSPIDPTERLGALLERVVTPWPEVERDAVERFGQTWTRLREAGPPGMLRSPWELLVRTHGDRLLVVLVPTPDGADREVRAERLTDRLTQMGMSEDRLAPYLDPFVRIETVVHEALQPRAAADAAIHRWAAGAPGGGLAPSLLRELSFVDDNPV